MDVSSDEKPQVSHIEVAPNSKEEVEGRDLKFDSEGLPLVPQPSDDPEDPLNWPLWLKCAVLTQAALLGAVGNLNTAIINPAYTPLAAEFHISTVTASYQTAVVIAMNGVGPFIWIPLANVYGRRPIYIVSTLLGLATAIGSAFSKSFAQLVVARTIMGLYPAATALGACTAVDMFFLHQRGRAMGFYTVLVTTGSHVAPIIGGLIGQFIGWRWIFKFCAILNASMIVIIIFCMPETLYVREENELNPKRAYYSLSYPRLLRVRLKHHYATSPPSLAPSSFFLPVLKLIVKPWIVFPALYYATQYGFASILPAVTVAHIFAARFGFGVLQTGLAYGSALTIGAGLGELAAGMVIDRILKNERRKRPSGPIPPEIRLKAIWTGEILVPIGLLIYGFCIQYNVHWSGALIGMGIGCFGIQVITTTCYTYSIDCDINSSGSIAQFINFTRQEIGMTFAFYVIPLGDKIGYQVLFTAFAIIGSILAFAPIVALMIWGARWREMDKRTAREGGELQCDSEVLRDGEKA